jgi:hypothetical protein
MTKSNLISVLAAAMAITYNPTYTLAFAPATSQRTSTKSFTSLHAIHSRRALLTSSLLTTTAILLPLPSTAAANAPPTPEELSRIKTGYDNIQYLLANWEKETTVCRENGGECKRDADPVRKYLGLRSTTDPLFQIEKVFNKVKYMENVDVDRLDDFFEATEDW